MTTFRDINEALPWLAQTVLRGDEVGSRNGRTKERLFQQFTLTEPTRREILLPTRRASLPAQIAETMWVLGGRDDVEWLRAYLPRAGDFSDDGSRWRGAYGRRIRAWGDQYGDEHGSFDQLEYVVKLLQEDPATRRAVIAIYDPATDSKPGKDIPCNNWLHFLSRNGALDLHVAIRSNDLMWGWSGINAFEWSVLLEIVAGMTGMKVGSLHFSISSLHLYDQHWSKAERIGKDTPLPYSKEPSRFEPIPGMIALGDMISRWFTAEQAIRNGTFTADDLEDFGDPMFTEWLAVLAWWWSDDPVWLQHVSGTPLYTAAILSPPRRPVVNAGNFTITGDLTIESVSYVDEGPVFVLNKGTKVIEFTDPPKTTFLEYVTNLHREKDKVYGDSWKKRGEAGILANIARKADRLGVAGGGDTAADTAVDFLVYLAKYRDWLSLPDCANHVNDVTETLRRLDENAKRDGTPIVEPLVSGFSVLESSTTLADKKQAVNTLLRLAYPFAKSLWQKEQAK